MRKFSKALGVAAIAASAMTIGSAHAWWGGGPWGGYPGGGSWMDDWFGDGYGDFNMSMSGGGHGRGWNRYNSYYGPYGWGGPYGYGGYPGYGWGGYPGYGYGVPVAPAAPAAPATK